MILSCRIHRLAATKRDDAMPNPSVTDRTESNTTNRNARATLSGVSSGDCEGWSCGARKTMVPFQASADRMKGSMIFKAGMTMPGLRRQSYRYRRAPSLPTVSVDARTASRPPETFVIILDPFCFRSAKEAQKFPSASASLYKSATSAASSMDLLAFSN